MPLLYGFFERHQSLFTLVKPDASAICFPRLNVPGSVDEFCERLVPETSTMALPGSVYDLAQFVRIGYGRIDMPAALKLLEDFLVTI